MKSSTQRLRELIAGMREVYFRRGNAMEYARRESGSGVNSSEATLIAYDLQAGSYIAQVRADPTANARWCAQLSDTLTPWIDARSSLLEVGCGDATTLAGVVRNLPEKPRTVLGFDISWSRCFKGSEWLKAQEIPARLFVGDLFSVPLADASVDVVYTSHSIEPNGGREEAALRELLRITRRTLVLFEPLYELGSSAAQGRMRSHGYVMGLAKMAEKLGAHVVRHQLMPYSPNSLNPSGVIVIEKNPIVSRSEDDTSGIPAWLCPLTATPLMDARDVFCSPSMGTAYPVMRGIPLLRPEHVVIASKLEPREAGDGEASTGGSFTAGSIDRVAVAGGHV